MESEFLLKKHPWKKVRIIANKQVDIMPNFINVYLFFQM